MKKGFTLAEVLITLAVIGVVAALTIPVLINKYQKKQLYSQFMKTYNTLANAMDLITIEHGDLSSWTWDESDDSGESNSEDNPFVKYVVPQFKAIKTCDVAKDCYAEKYSELGGDDGSWLVEEYLASPAIILADGAVIGVDGDSNSGEITFVIDTNGKKAPNVFGRDLFYLRYNVVAEEGEQVGFNLVEYDSNATGGVDGNCNPNDSGAEGFACASRLLQEGKMDY